MGTSKSIVTHPNATYVQYVASAACTRGHVVALSTDMEVANATTEAAGIGIAENDAVAGELVTVCVAGPSNVVLGEAWTFSTAGPFFTNDTASEAHVPTDTQRVIGYLTPDPKSGNALADQDLIPCVVALSTYSV